MKSIFILLFTACAAEISKSDVKYADRVAFVKSIELAEPKYNVVPDRLQQYRSLKKLGLPPNNTKEGYVNAGAITAFTQNVKGRVKQDIIESTLLAQLAANAKYDQESAPTDWYKFYNKVVVDLGYMVLSFKTFQEYKPLGSSFSMDTAVLKELNPALGVSEVMNETLIALRRMVESDHHLQLFSNWSTNGSSSGNFQIYPCDQSSSGDVSLVLESFYFTASSHDARYLFTNWKTGSTHLYKSVQGIILNQGIYDRVRSTVSSRLGDLATKLVASIEL